jgi:hypothetical protein
MMNSRELGPGASLSFTKKEINKKGREPLALMLHKNILI